MSGGRHAQSTGESGRGGLKPRPVDSLPSIRNHQAVHNRQSEKRAIDSIVFAGHFLPDCPKYVKNICEEREYSRTQQCGRNLDGKGDEK
jgi:hypothetical protein